PQANRAPLTAVATAPAPGGAVAAASGDQALAVGLAGTALEYTPGSGWAAEPLPGRYRRLSLLGVAYASPTTAYAVGQFGAILVPDANGWSEAPASVTLTQSQLNAVAFAPSGEGWAVGADGTILHHTGSGWSEEQPPVEDQGTNITSVAVAGADVFAVAGGHLIMRAADGSWQPADDLLPADARRALQRLRQV